MKLKLKLNKNYRNINYKVVATSLIAITLVGITGISIGRFYGKSPISMNIIMDGISAVGEGINTGFTFVKDEFDDLIKYRENARIVEETSTQNQELQQQVIDFKNELESVESLEKLKKGLDYIDESYKQSAISTSVVSKNDGNWYETVVLGAGEAQGIKENSVVINGSGVVGIVYEVSQNYSKAISLLDTKSSISFKLVSNGEYQGVLTENVTLEDKESYREKGFLYGYVFDSGYEILPGDIITTSGIGLYPEGIPIGEVDKVIDDKNSSMKYVIVRPYVNFKNIDDVIVVEPREID